MRKILAALSVSLALLPLAMARADEPTGLRGNQRLIASEGRSILGMAHPTVRFTGAELDGRTDLADGGYVLAYVFNFRDGDDDGYRVIRFSFDNQGKLTKLTPGPGSTFVPAFFGSDLILEAAKAALRNDPKKADDPVVQQLLKVRSGQEFLLQYLQWRQGS